MSLQTTLDAIEQERSHQEERWGVVSDDSNTLSDWLGYISKYTCKAALASSNRRRVRRRLIQVAALAVAAVEASDRNLGFPEPRGVASDV